MKTFKKETFYTIKKFQPKVPTQFTENYWRIHALRDKLVFLHTLLFEIKIGMKIKINVKDKPENQDLVDFALQSKNPKYQWFVLVSLIDRMLNDFCHYTYFGLLAINPAHVATAYTLLRKPYEQTLPLTEWIMVNTNEFLDRFINSNGDLDKYLQKKNIEARKKMRESASKLIDFPFQQLIDEFINIEHYDSSAHLITTRTAPTENINMNFIFLNEDKELAENHTSFLIYMNSIYLAYTNALFLAIFGSIDASKFIKPKKIKSIQDSIDHSYFLLHSYALMLVVLSKNDSDNLEIINLFNMYAQALETKCNNCTAIVKVSDIKDLKIFSDYDTLYCENCKNIIINNTPTRLEEIDAE